MSKEKLSTHFAIQDAVLISDYHPAVSPFGYKGYGTVTNFVTYWTYINSINNASLGGTLRFTIPRQQDFLGPVWVYVNTSAVTPVSPATQAWLCDYFGFQLLQNLLVKYAANIIQNLYPTALYALHKCHRDLKAAYAANILIGGEMSDGDRQTAANGQQYFWVELPAPWGAHPETYEFTEALSQEMEFIFTLASAQQTTQGNSGSAGGTYTLNTLQLYTLLVHVDKEERELNVQKMLSGGGIIRHIRDFEYVSGILVPSGTTTQNVPLSGIRGSVVNLRFMFRLDSTLNSFGQSGFYPFRAYRINDINTTANWQITAAGLQVWPITVAKENVYLQNVIHFSAFPGEPLYGYCPGIDVEDVINCTGHDSYSGLSNAMLMLNFVTATSANMWLDIVTIDDNTIQTSKGDEIRNFV